MFEREKEILREEAGSDRFLQMMAKQTIELIDERKSAGIVGQEGKTLSDLKRTFDKFAEEHKTGNRSVIMPDEAAEMICDYFEIYEERKQAGKIDVLDLL